ncbi:MAG: complex I NDUFA9 subunit family protein [Rhodocyclales bacterium]|nr:complex I NDUFA9 subunit family protein [Rhodocyclales bacterium]
MTAQRIVLIGGSGFIGSAIAARLCAASHDVLIPTRHRSRAAHLLLLPTAEVVDADVHDPAQLASLLRGADAVVNLVGILHSRPGTPYGADFARAHVELPRKIVAACRDAAVPRLVHVSALGANPNGPSAYQRSKAAGEAAIHAGDDMLATTILRPSVVFGRGDSFLNLFARLVRLFPVLPLAGAQARFQPVYVEDVAEVVLRGLDDPARGGKTFELGGPHVYALRDLVGYIAALLGRHPLIIALPERLALLQAALMELAPQPLMSRDNVLSMRVDNVTAAPLPYDVTPTPLETVAPAWICNDTPRARVRNRVH